MQIVVTALGKRFVIDDNELYMFLKGRAQELDVQQQRPVREVNDNSTDDRVLLKG